ncbi:universal stress protein [Proteus myxofaciens]|uniref:Universal stress protein F n=1 Tax=Proteus myxofaciens ATCC 19692 TaxID=1354337 RepID=A0A198GLJ1_9GAMM|nr:universal stress protein [Proteus myxofaciens]OAT37056.1 universal stress protein F [Proteus myxofaciens ATCC 19692]
MAKTIVVAIDLLEDNKIQRMIADVQFLAKNPQHYFHFIAVMPNLRALETYNIHCDSESITEKKDKALTMLTEKLTSCVQQFKLPTLQYCCHAVIGTPNYNILAYADKIDADMIVIGSSSRNKDNITFGSTADYIVNNTSRSVFIIR